MICFTNAAYLSLHCVRPACGNACHEAGQFRQLHESEQRAALPQYDLRIWSDGVSPLRRNRTDCAIIEAQQQAPAGPVVSLADTDGSPPSKRMEGVGYDDMLRGSEGNACILK